MNPAALLGGMMDKVDKELDGIATYGNENERAMAIVILANKQRLDAMEGIVNKYAAHIEVTKQPETKKPKKKRAGSKIPRTMPNGQRGDEDEE
jgi:hypothetical protein